MVLLAVEANRLAKDIDGGDVQTNEEWEKGRERQEELV
jgi:hypothetical protein